MADESPFIREIRINPLVPTESVLIATQRQLRPQPEKKPFVRDRRAYADDCPFCRGNEAMTPPTLEAHPEEAVWDIRVISNLYPVLGDDRLQRPGQAFGILQVIDGYGRHEVMVEHPHHGIALHEMSQAHIASLLQIYRERMIQLYSSDPAFRYVLIFRNFGPEAGASLDHPHSQIVAMPLVPQFLQNEAFHSHQHHLQHGDCIYCALIDEQRSYQATYIDPVKGACQRRIELARFLVERGERFVAIKPFASRFEWEVHILPRAHQSDFQEINSADCADLARVLKRTLARLEQVTGGTQFNYFLHSRPPGEAYRDHRDSFHWHLEICPRTSIHAGLELGSGLYVNSVSPEQGAEQLRAVRLDDN